MGSVEAAKAYLMTANSSGVSLYDHLSEVLSKILAEKPENALEQLEAISAQIKASRYSPAVAAPGSAALDERTLARVKEIEALLKGPKAVVDADGNMDVPAKNVLAKPKAVSVLEAAELADKAGVGMGKAEMYRVAIAIKRLGEDAAQGLVSCRFWGKIYGSKADYLIAEAETGERESTLPSLSDEEMYDLKVVAPEAPGVGANKHVYYVCSHAGKAWTRLPDVTPAQIMAAKSIKKLFTGELDAPVNSYPPFPGGEAEYLRAQITRISADTVIAPDQYMQPVEAEEEPEEETEIDPFKDDASMAAYKAKQLITVAEGHSYTDAQFRVAATDGSEFEGYTDMNEVAVPTVWVHAARPLLDKQGRCSWYEIPKRPKPPPAEGEEEEEGGEEEEAAAEPEEPKEHGASIEADAAVAEDGETEGSGEPAWRFRTHMAGGGGVHGKATVVSCKSVRWPGAVTLSGFGGPHAIMFTNMYFGNGSEYSATSAGATYFSPPLPASVQTEWAPAAPADDEEEEAPFTLQEETDATVAEEEEEAERIAAEAESAADAEGGEEE